MIKIRQIKIAVLEDSEERLKKKITKILQVQEQNIKEIKIVKKSLDARLKQIFYIYEVNVWVANEELILKKNKNPNVLLASEPQKLILTKGVKPLTSKIIIVGSGPAGLFAAYFLAMHGYKPLIIERGKVLEERIKDVELFWQTNILNEESNVVFGEGGAGTFSDGKLNTLIKDPRSIGVRILEIFVENGAPKEILYMQKPHIGTNLLRQVIKNIRIKIMETGGEFRFETKLTDLVIKDNKLEKIIINNQKEIKCQHLILAIGHSARDTFGMLLNKKVKMESKPFAVGVRVMHPQAMINESLYHEYAKVLPPASYKLTYTTSKKRGVYSFCMCPGGYVVNSSNEKGELVINGMSNFERNSSSSNSAIVVSVTKRDFGEDVLDGLKFQKMLEEKAYQLGHGLIPIQTLKDFKNNEVTQKDLPNLDVKGDLLLANVREIFPQFINEALIEAMANFGQKIKGFDNDETWILGVESRTSSPVKIIRNENYEANIKGIYPCGEGSGYAGGIITSAIDGFKVAEQLIKEYKN